jgi:hypothetical protein
MKIMACKIIDGKVANYLFTPIGINLPNFMLKDDRAKRVNVLEVDGEVEACLCHDSCIISDQQGYSNMKDVVIA